jgi:hypothetical protein
MSGKTYYFPFRLNLEPIREFEEAMVRPEFAFVAENLLLRGGYRKTHFQADQTTLQSVSQMGDLYKRPMEKLGLSNCEAFIPRLTWNKSLVSHPEVFYFQELILQSLIRQFLSLNSNLQALFDYSDLDKLQAKDFEVLGEKALPEGHIDILVKDCIPTGYSRKVIVEVKTGKPQLRDIVQLRDYTEQVGKECVGGVLVANSFSRKIQIQAKDSSIKCFVYSFDQIDKNGEYSLDELKSNFRLVNI